MCTFLLDVMSLSLNSFSESPGMRCKKNWKYHIFMQLYAYICHKCHHCLKSKSGKQKCYDIRFSCKCLRSFKSRRHNFIGSWLYFKLYFSNSKYIMFSSVLNLDSLENGKIIRNKIAEKDVFVKITVLHVIYQYSWPPIVLNLYTEKMKKLFLNFKNLGKVFWNIWKYLFT